MNGISHTELYQFLSLLSNIENSTAHRHIAKSEVGVTIWEKGTNYGKRDFNITTAWRRLDETHRQALTDYLLTMISRRTE